MKFLVLLFLFFSTILSQTTYTFTSCGQGGPYGPSQSQCNSEYYDTELEGQVSLNNGTQEWVVPTNG